MTKKFHHCLTEGKVSYIAVEGEAYAYNVSYDEERSINMWRGYLNDEKTALSTITADQSPA